MDQDSLFDRLLETTRAACVAHPDVAGFAPFPDDVTRQTIEPYHCPCGTFLRHELGWADERYGDLRAAIIDASPHAHWRETYKGTDIGSDFMDRFGCYAIIGPGGPFTSETGRVWMVYMPPRLYYPWHHHPGEEMYLIVSGQAVFRKKGAPDQQLGPGQTVRHASNQPHDMETYDSPVLCLVLWRNGFETPPVLTP